MSEFSGNRLGHLPDDVCSREQVLMWINAMIWELDLPAELILNEQTAEGFTRMSGFNCIEKTRFMSFLAQATSLDPAYLQFVIRQEAMTKRRRTNDCRATIGSSLITSRGCKRICA
jgi:hypothetical protein